MTVIFIALLHGVPVFLIGAMTKSKVALTLSAVVAAAVGVMTGNPAYIAVDLIAVAVAFGLGMLAIGSGGRELAAPPQSSAPETAKKPESGSSWVGGALVVGVLAIFLYNKFADSPKPSPAYQPPQATQSPPRPDSPIQSSGREVRPLLRDNQTLDQYLAEQAAANVRAEEQLKRSRANANTIHTKPPPQTSTARSPSRDLPPSRFASFLVAAESGTPVDLDYMVKTGANVNDRIRGLTPLVAAVRVSNYQNAEFLLVAGADANTVDSYGQSPLLHALARNDMRMAELLQRYGAQK
jgi:hypothetical protein